MCFYNKNGFTLAEVLVTLAIIGVVAALTIPTLIQNTQNAQFAVGAKKGYSLLSQATKMLSLDYNESFTGDCFSTSHEPAFNCFITKLKVAKNCGIGSGCFFDDGSSTPYKYLNGENYTNIDAGNWGKAILSNGMSIAIFDYGGDCSFDRGDGSLKNSCALVIFDINGIKGPNRLGRDVFLGNITRNGEFVASGNYQCMDSFKSCDPAVEDSGDGCLAKILKEGKMNY